MPVRKTPCPKCDASMRFTVEGEGDHEVTCLKCGHDFTATLEPAEPPAPKKAKDGTGTKVKAKDADAKPAKVKSKKARDDDDEEEDAPKKKKKKGEPEEDGKRRSFFSWVASRA